MSNYKKNCIEVNRNEEKQFYRICKDLELHGEALIETTKNPEWENSYRLFGKRAAPLIKDGLLDPIWKTTHPGDKDKRLIRIKKNVKVEEKKGSKISWFKLEKII